jgi:hypothetical protein
MAEGSQVRPGPVRPPPEIPYFAPMRPEPSWERLNSPSSRVTVTNTSQEQNHIVVDRFCVGHELRPGQKVEIEMLNDEIATFQQHRLPDRYYPAIDPAKPGLPKPPHPIKIDGVGSMIEDRRRAQDARQAALFAERQEAQKRERDQKGRFAPG